MYQVKKCNYTIIIKSRLIKNNYCRYICIFGIFRDEMRFICKCDKSFFGHKQGDIHCSV